METWRIHNSDGLLEVYHDKSNYRKRAECGFRTGDYITYEYVGESIMKKAVVKMVGGRLVPVRELDRSTNNLIEEKIKVV